MMRLTNLAAVIQLFYCNVGASVEAKSVIHERGLDEGHLKLGLTYSPTTDVSRALNIENDQFMIEFHLGAKTEESYKLALDVYQNSDMSLPEASLTATDALASALTNGTAFTGLSDTDTSVTVVTIGNYEEGDSMLTFRYLVNDCRVEDAEPETSGCLKESGVLTSENDSNLTIAYTYDVLSDNKNALTIQSLSLNAEKEYMNSETFSAFVDYYGRGDYSDAWVSASFDGVPAELGSRIANMTLYGASGRSQGIKKGTAYLIVWIAVIGEMDKALDACDSNDTNAAAAAWDTAVAYFTGKVTNDDSGHLIYALGNKRCENFKTCSGFDKVSGTAQINEDAMAYFEQGQLFLSQNKCDDARDAKDEVQKQLTAALVQGALRYLYRSYELKAGENEKIDAEAANFVAAIIPVVSACNEEDAETIQKYGQVGYKGEVDYAAIKEAFENNYDCMNIECDDVGGLWDDEVGAYFPLAGPCTFSKSGATMPTGIIAIGLGFLGVAIQSFM